MRRGALVLAHAATFIVVLGLGRLHALYIGDYEFTGTSRFGWLIGYAALLSIAAYSAGIPDVPITARSALSAAAGAALLSALAVSLVQLVLGSLLLPRYVVFWSAVVLVPVYSICTWVSKGGRDRREERDRLLVVAGAEEVSALRHDLVMAPERPATIAAVAEPGTSLVDAARVSGANVVILDRKAAAEPTVVEQAAMLHEKGLRIRTLSLFYEEWLGKLPVSELERTSLMFDIGELHRARYARLRRVADLFLACGGIVVLAGLMPLVGLGNLVANRGPLFHRQNRVGRNGRLFVIYKFRTMRPGSDPQTWATRDDSRVTPFGNLMRRTHLDELPQVINMLRGHLSLVGPRPEQPSYVEELRQKIPFYDLRHLVRPGLTGWAQVKYGYAGDERAALEKLQYDFYYLRHQGPLLDARILIRTPRSTHADRRART